MALGGAGAVPGAPATAPGEEEGGAEADDTTAAKALAATFGGGVRKEPEDKTYALITGVRPKFGEGREEIPGGGYYEGPFRYGKRHGAGVLVSNEEGTERYDGQFKNELIDGKGRKIWPDGSVYEGEWVQNRKGGEGTLDERGRGQTYTGQWRDGVRHGVGEQQYEKGHWYRGYWENGLQHGTGKFFDGEKGTLYEGHWHRGAHHGEGVLRSPGLKTGDDSLRERLVYSYGVLTSREILRQPFEYTPIPVPPPMTEEN